ncbi:MAG: acetylglutamate kinase [Actinomycetaceae bacterium]|nr:acetylglutamate kinase [Actinomycetaceae bacterium]
MSTTLTPEQKTAVLIETIPWLRKYAGKRVVIKYGGNAMTDPELQKAFAQDVVLLLQWGIYPIVVHGGGPQISQMLEALNIESQFIGGLRVTTPETMDVVRMVLTGRVQRELVSLINAQAIRAVGISGEDSGLFHARRVKREIDGKPVDLGQVGEVVHVNPLPIEDLLSSGRIPVISSIAIDVDDAESVLNINADLAAAHIAQALNADKLMVLTNVKGIYRDYPDPDSLIRCLPLAQARELLKEMETGMVPKLAACIQAIEGGVRQATVVDGRIPHQTLLEIFTDDGVGTMVVAKDTDCVEFMRSTKYRKKGFNENAMDDLGMVGGIQ